MSDEDRLTQLVLEWEELRQSGRSAPIEEVCRDCPELVEPLRQRVCALEAMEAAMADSKAEGQKATVPSQETAAKPPREGARLPEIPGYEILQELGRGGMGVVYKARQLGLERVVALKMILAGPAARAVDVTRFRSEVEAVARVQHPNLVQIYEIGEHQGRPYYSMEYVSGGDLAEQADGKPQPARAAAELVETLAWAIHAVHQQGIVHRDLKPANILLVDGGRGTGDSEKPESPSTVHCPPFTPKITDFGLAKRLDTEQGPTLSQHILGTPNYMAPEQAEGRSKHVSAATDVYALGAILYELLTGRPPFQSETVLDTISQVIHLDPVPPRRLLPTVPRDLETICLKCLHKVPGRRYASAQALAEDLQRFHKGEPILARPVGVGERVLKWARRRPAAAALWIVSIVSLIVLAGGGVMYHLQLQRALQAEQAHAEESRQRLVRLHVAQGVHALDSGDWFTALLWFSEALRLEKDDPERAKVHRLRLGTVAEGCPRLVQIWFHDGPVRHAQFSPDGKRVLTTSEDHTARVWDVATGEQVGPALKHQGAVVQGSFRPDGLRVVTASADRTARVWEVGSGKLVATLEHGGAVTSVAFNNDGSRVLTASEDGTGRVWESESGRLVASVQHAKTVQLAAFSNDGQQFVTASLDHTARVWNAETGAALTPSLTHSGAVNYAAFHQNGRRLVTASADSKARVWEVAQDPGMPLILEHRAAVTMAAFSAGGGQILTTSDDQTARVWETTSGQLLLPPLKHTSAVSFANFSPSGDAIATASDDDTGRVWDTASGNPRSPPLKHGGSVHVAAFSPQGRLVISCANDNTARLWEVGPERGGPRVAKRHLDQVPVWRPSKGWLSGDGRWLVTAEEGYSAQVRDAATRQAKGPLLKHGSTVLFAVFNGDGSRLITASDDNTARIWDTASGKLLTQPLQQAGTVWFAAFSPDGKSMVVTAGTDQTARVWDAITGEPITRALKFTGEVYGVAFPAADAVAVTSVLDKEEMTWTWTLRGDDRPLGELLRSARLLSGSQIDPNRGLLPLDPAELKAAWQETLAR
jgi:WD40 repeat protein